jgi:hypothetical protein
VIYIMVAALALIVGLALDKPRLTAALTVLSSLTMAGLLLWIELGPATDDVHPSNAVMGSDNVLFRVFGIAMLVTCLVWVLALVVPVRRWLAEHAHEHDPAPPAAVTGA